MRECVRVFVVPHPQKPHPVAQSTGWVAGLSLSFFMCSLIAATRLCALVQRISPRFFLRCCVRLCKSVVDITHT